MTEKLSGVIMSPYAKKKACLPFQRAISPAENLLPCGRNPFSKGASLKGKNLLQRICFLVVGTPSQRELVLKGRICCLEKGGK